MVSRRTCFRAAGEDLEAACHDRHQLGHRGEVPVDADGHQRNAKLFLTVLLGPFERVDGLYGVSALYPRSCSEEESD